MLPHIRSVDSGTFYAVIRRPARSKTYINSRTLVSHTFVFLYMREFGYYILFGACGIKINHYETTKDN